MHMQGWEGLLVAIFVDSVPQSVQMEGAVFVRGPCNLTVQEKWSKPAPESTGGREVPGPEESEGVDGGGAGAPRRMIEPRRRLHHSWAEVISTALPRAGVGKTREESDPEGKMFSQ